MLFVLLVPGATGAAFAALRAGLALLVVPGAWAADASFASLLVRFWLDHGLGMIVVAPPLLALVTPWLAQRGWARPELAPLRVSRATSEGAIMPSAGAASPWRWGDWLEIGGLAFVATVLCLLLSGMREVERLLSWQFWGAQLLLIVWASLRQGCAAAPSWRRPRPPPR